MPAKVVKAPKKADSGVARPQAKLPKRAGKAPALSPPATEAQDESSDEDEDEDYVTTEDDDEDDSEDQEGDEDAEGKDVSRKGLRRLMEALEREGIDLNDLESEDEDEDDEDESDAEEDDEEEAGDQQPSASTSKANGASHKSSLAESLLRSGLVPALEEEDDDEEDYEDEDEGDDEVLLEDLDQDTLPEAVLATKINRIRKNDSEALKRVLDEFRLSGAGEGKMPWIETMDVTWDMDAREEVGEDVEDDLKREVTLYKQALHAAIEGRKRTDALNIPFTRPADFFAEMVKTDEHMERVRQKLLDERAGIKASEEAKKQRELKKFGKKVQVEKLLERQKRKKDMADKVKGLRQRGGGEDDNDFDVHLHEALGEGGGSGDRVRPKTGKGNDGKAKMPRSKRDDKYGFGGKKRHAKENTRQSTDAFDGPSSKKRRISGSAGFRKPNGKKSRPGKSKRAGGR